MKNHIGLFGSVLVASALVFGASAATTSVSDVANLPTTGGEGTIHYTGPSATAPNTLTLAPAAKKAATVEVDAGKNLTYTKAVSVTGGALIKTGGGTLTLDTTAASVLGEGNPDNPDQALTFSDGNATGGFRALTVADGALVLSNAAQKITSAHVHVGVNYDWTTSPSLFLWGGSYTGKALYVDAGASTTARGTAGATATFAGGAQVSLTDLQATTAGTGSSYNGKPHVIVKDANTKVTVSGYSHIGFMAANFDYTLDTLGGATLINNRSNMDETYCIGILLGRFTESRRGTWNIRGAGTLGSTHLLFLSRYSNLNVTDGARLEIDRTPPILLRPNAQYKSIAPKIQPPSVNGYEQVGTALFDDAILSTRSGGTMAADWFTGITNYLVGAGGLNVRPRASLTAFAGNALYADAAAKAANAEITITTNGTIAWNTTLAMGAGAVPIRLKDNGVRLQMTVNGRQGGSASTGCLYNESDSSLAAPCRVMVAGENSLQEMQIDESIVGANDYRKDTRFRHQGIETDRPRWTTVRAASFLANGTLRLGGPATSDANCPGWGAAWLKEKLPVDRSFAIEWTWYGQSDVPASVFGLSAVFQNAADGSLTHPGNGNVRGYTNMANSVAVAYDYANGCHVFGTNGAWSQTDALAEGKRATAGSDDPMRMRLAYDVSAHTLTFESYYPNNGYRKTSTFAVNLAETCGGNEAYFGFVGGSVSKNLDGCSLNNATVWYLVDDIRLSAEQGRGYQKVGGHATIGAGKSWRVHPLADKVNLGFVMNSLTYGDGASFNVYNATQTGLADTEAEAQAVNVGFDRITGTGTLHKDGSAKLSITEAGGATNASVNVRGGGLVLRKENAEEPTLKAADGGWSFRGPCVYWAGDKAIQIGPLTCGSSVGDTKVAELAQAATTRRHYRVDGAWKASFHVHAESTTGNNGQGYSFILHNDPRGADTRAGDLCGSRRIANGMALRRWIWFDSKEWAWMGPAESSDVAGRGSSTAVDMTDSGVTLKNSAGADEDVVIEHLPDAKQIRVIVTQGVHAFTNTFACDVKTLVGNLNRARLMFAVRGGDSQNTSFVFSNLTFTYPEGQADEDAATPYFGTLATTLDTLPIQLDTAKTNANFRLAKSFSLPANKTLSVTAKRAPAVLDLDALTCAGAATVQLGTGASAAVRAVSGAQAFTVNGGTLAITASDAFPENAELYLTQGAKLKLDFAGTLNVRRVYVNGVKVASGRYSSASWIAEGSTGALQTGRGLVLIVR